jgi:hypothetical protein
MFHRHRIPIPPQSRLERLLALLPCPQALLLLAALAVSVVCTVHAWTATLTGNTKDQPAWKRPIADRNNAPSVLTGIGHKVPFLACPFNVSADGNYDFLGTSTVPAGWDGYSLVHKDSFDSTQPLVNVLIANDDFPAPGKTGFNGVNLSAGHQYFFVMTGFGNLDLGEYGVTINGPGDIAVGHPSASRRQRHSPHGRRHQSYYQQALLSDPGAIKQNRKEHSGEVVRFSVQKAARLGEVKPEYDPPHYHRTATTRCAVENFEAWRAANPRAYRKCERSAATKGSSPCAGWRLLGLLARMMPQEVNGDDYVNATTQQRTP